MSVSHKRVRAALMLAASLALQPLALAPAQAATTTEPAISTAEVTADPVTVAVTVSGRAVVGSTLTAAAPEVGSDATGTTYTWYADGTPIPGASAATYQLTTAETGRRITVEVSATRTDGTPLTGVSAPTLMVARASTPTISGQVGTGVTLYAKTGTWTSGTTFTYEWYANGVLVSTASKITPSSTLEGQRLTVKVTGSKAGHPTVTKTSAQTARLLRTSKPTISGTAVAGATLKASSGTWTSYATKRFQWYANGTAISGATSSSFTIPSSLKDKKITVKVTGSKTGYGTVTRTSSATKYVQVAPTPTISGTKKVGYTLTAVKGTWSSGTAFTYQWYADGIALSGKTSSTLKLSSSHVGRSIKVKVTGTKSGYPTVARTSAGTADITYPLVTQPYTDGSCPSWAPIKGNQGDYDWIYHVPGGRYYDITHAEECFRTTAAAEDAGYRASRNG